MNPFSKWIVFRYHFERDVYEEVGACDAPSAGDAFRQVVLPPSNVVRPTPTGEYRVFSLEGAAHLGVGLTLRDLDAPQNPQSGVEEGERR